MPTSFHLAQGFTLAALIATGLPFILGCQKDDDKPTTQTIVVYVDTVTVPPGAVADVDGNVYPTTVVGTQRWMAENLRTSHYANGDPISYAPESTQWVGQNTGAWTNYAGDFGYDAIYGKLYNWYTVVDPRNVCPDGWHVASDDEWKELESAMGVPLSDLDVYGERGSDSNVGGQLKSVILWDDPNSGANDSSGFSGYPGGERLPPGTFSSISAKGIWWTASEYDPGLAWLRELYNTSTGVYRLYHFKTQGCSVRCVED